MKKVSVHIVSYNSEDCLRDCLMSVFEQTYPVEQIIVIDNASKDDTLAIVKEIKDPRLVIIANEQNTGFAQGHNQAIQISKSDYYLVLNPDVTLHSDYVYFLLKCFEKDEKLGSATGKLLFKQEKSKVDSTGLIINKARRAFDRGAGDSKKLWDQAGDVFGVSGAAAIYSAKMVQDISLDGEFYDADFFAYKEDVDVAWRSRIMGWTAIYEPRAIAYHARGWKKNSRKQIPLFIRRYSYINRYKMMIKNDRLLYVLRHGIPFFCYEILSLIYFMIREPKVLAAWKGLLLNWKTLLRKRRWIQSRHKVSDEEIYKYFM